MALFSIRLPDDIESGLSEEAERSNRSKSEVIRDALTEYLRQQAHERFLAQMEAAARALGSDAKSRGEALETAEEFLVLDNEALAVGEPRAEYKVTRRTRRTGKRKR